MNLSIEITGAEKLDFALRGVAEDISDFRKVARPVSDEIYSIVREQFSTQGARAGSKWPKRSDAYLASLTRLNRGGFRSIAEPLRSSDALFRAVTTRGAPGGIYDPQEDSLTLGTNLTSARGFPYPRAHQQGGDTLPQRRIYDLTERDVQNIGRVIKRAYREEIADRGFDFVDAAEIPF